MTRKIDFELLEEMPGFGVRFKLYEKERECSWCKKEDILRHHAPMMMLRGEITPEEMLELIEYSKEKLESEAWWKVSRKSEGTNKLD